MKRLFGTLVAGFVLLMAANAPAASRYALVVNGVSGSPEYQATHTKRREALVKALTGPLALPEANLVVLKDGRADAADSATREHVMAAVRSFASRLNADDVFVIILLGHGTDDGVDAKFNLVGPDMTAEDWRGLLQPIGARIVFINTTAASSRFLARLAGPHRIVITATDTPAQQYDTVFADFLATAFTSPEADLDKDGRVSLGEGFAFVSARVKEFYAQRGQLATERAVLDDTGDGKGKEAGSTGDDGALASRTFIDAGPEVAASRDPALSQMLARRDKLENDLDELRRKKEFMPEADYEQELERLLVEIARVSQQIKEKS